MNLPEAEVLLNDLAASLKKIIRPDTALVGLYSGGAWLVERLIPMLARDLDASSLDHGVLDSSFYRDDFNKRGLHAEPKPSHIPFEVQDRHIILIDDVFYTGRTIRAAMNELFDYGRPASITLAVLVNRGGRELPIAPQISAYDCELTAAQNLQLLRNDDGSFYLKLEDTK